ncbi:MAG: hypothetical protein WC538_02720 [Thermoanaerobaculia bacterium]|jgi:hypothetical protein
MKRGAWRVAFIALAALAPFLPMLVRGEVPDFRDHRDYFVPMREATAGALRGLELPLWNSLSGSGEPWLANPQTGVFYPPAWLMALLPFKTGYAIFLALHLAIAGIGWRRLMLRWTGDGVATLSACALLLSGPILSLLELSTVLATLAWIPLLLAFALEPRASGSIVRDAVTIALCFLGGEPLLAAVGALLYASARLARERRASLRPVSLVAALAFLLTAAQLLPFVESLQGSDRANGLDRASALAQSMAPLDWLRIPLSPFAPGAASVTLTSQRFLPSLYVVPVIALLPIVLPLLWRRERVPRRACGGWLILFAVSAFISAGSSLAVTERVYLMLGLEVNRYPVKFALFGVLALVALGTICLDRLLECTKEEAPWGAAVIAIAALLPLLLAFGARWNAALLLGAWVVAIAVVVVAKPTRAWALPLLALAVCADSMHSSQFLLKSQPLPLSVMPHDSLLSRERKVVRLEQLDRRSGAVASSASRGAWLGGYLNLRNSQYDAMTAAPVIDARYERLLDYALARPRIDILDFLGAGYLLTTRRIDVPGYREIGATDGVRVYERAAALSPVTIWENHVSQGDRAAAFESLFSESWSAAKQIVVTGNAPARPSDAVDGTVGRTRVVATTWSSLRADVESPRGGVAVVSQRDAPGWSVAVDGAEAQPLLVDGLFRGVAVPVGRHTVEWRYAPRSLAIGALLSVTGVAIAVITIFRRRRRKSA